MTQTPSAPVIKVDSLTRQFGAFVAVDDVSFQIQQGGIFGLLGPNGSGKSTIIRMLLGILTPTRGSVHVLGRNAVTEPETIKPLVGYMSQQFSLYTDLTVRENLDFYARVYGIQSDALAERRQETISLVGLDDRVDQLAGTLSGGWKQRLALACSLIHQPRILFLDEPTAGIDPVARRDLWDLLFDLSGRGITLLVTTHYMDEAERCTSIGYLWNSKLLVTGRPEELKQLSSVTPQGTRRLELKTAQPTRALHAIRKHAAIMDATLFGENIHLLVADKFSPDDLQSVDLLGDDEYVVRETSPSLEDVFVTLTRTANQYRDTPDIVDVTTEDNVLSSEHVQPENRLTADEAPTSNAGDPDKPNDDRLDSSFRPQANRTTLGFWAVFIKEFVHIQRQPTTLFFMFVVPLIQLIIFGFAIKSQIEHIPLAVLNFDNRIQSELLIERLENSQSFSVKQNVRSREELDQAIRAGQVRVGLIIPPDFTDRILQPEQTELQLLVDGSDSQVASTAESAAQRIGQQMSLELTQQSPESTVVATARNRDGDRVLSIDVRSRLLFNPDLESAYFFVPGLVGIVLQLVTLFLTAFAIVRERENGTLEQLFVTPVGRVGLMLGKLLPYAIIGIIEILTLLVAMVFVFHVPIQGNLIQLLTLSILFIFCSLGLGLFISTVAKSQLEAFQMAFIIMLPSILLSGFMFPRSEMPLPIYAISFLLPATYFIEILRGIILRSAHWLDLLPSILGLFACTIVVLTASISRFTKKTS